MTFSFVVLQNETYDQYLLLAKLRNLQSPLQKKKHSGLISDRMTIAV